MSTRNHIARHAWKFNKPKTHKAKKGKGSFTRVNRIDVRNCSRQMLELY